MDSGEYEELKGLIERLTHSGSPMPGEPDVKKLKTLCRSASSEGRSGGGTSSEGWHVFRGVARLPRGGTSSEGWHVFRGVARLPRGGTSSRKFLCICPCPNQMTHALNGAAVHTCAKLFVYALTVMSACLWLGLATGFTCSEGRSPHTGSLGSLALKGGHHTLVHWVHLL